MKSLQKIIKEKEEEINKLKTELQNKDNNLKNKEIKKLYSFDDIKIVHFISTDNNINYSIKCLNTDTFAEVEEKLYKEYPKYRETNNLFLYEGKPILRFKTINDNKIKDGLSVTMDVP